MKHQIMVFAIAALTFACAPSSAPRGANAPPEMESATTQIGALAIGNAWASATPGGANVAAAYLTIANLGDEPDSLIAASSPRAARVEFHETQVEDGIARMQRLTQVAVPAHGAVAMAPGGMHVMFVNIDAPFAPGEQAELTLRFENAGAVTFALPVRTRLGADQANAHAGHAH